MTKARSFSSRKSKLILNKLVDKLRDGISPEEFKDIIASEPETENDLKEGEIFNIGVLDTGFDNEQESEIVTETSKTALIIQNNILLIYRIL